MPRWRGWSSSSQMHELGKALLILGIVLVAVGLVLLFAPKLPFLGRLPGDILIKRRSYTFYFPLATSIILSILLSIVLYLINRLR
jgi:hypothetical protein